MKIVLIATGGTELGYGHLTRSLTFFKNAPQDIDIHFFPWVKERDQRLFPKKSNIIFPSSYIQLIDKIKEIAPDLIIWDTIDFDNEAFAAIKELSNKHISISPVFKYMQHMDFVFSRNINQKKEQGVIYYLGMEYAIFNDNCKFITDEIYIKNLAKDDLVVGISMGGGDAPNKTLKVLEAISALDFPMIIWVLLGEGYSHSYQNLVNTINKNSRHEIILAKTNRSMWDILSNCNVAILAGGLMLIESVYAGLPSINIFEKKLHEKTAGTAFFEKDAAISVGNINDNISLDKLQETLSILRHKKSILLKMRENSKGLIDKNASTRIYDKMRNIYEL